jgi:hypothetical protein
VAVFDRPRETRDNLPRGDCSLEYWLKGLIPNIPPSAALRLSESRLLAGDLGSKHRQLFAVPVSTGEVCYVLVPNATDSCGDVFDFTFWDPDHYMEGEPTMVYGMVPNDVIGVQLRDRGRWNDAQVALNAFYYESSSWDFHGGSIRLHYRSGESETAF